jgi:DNA-binding XRE family transcriptional regulator
VAKTAGICRQTLHVFESGRHTPKPATLAAIFGALDRLKTKPPRKKSRQAV